jgi:hypothetical protein
MAEDQYVIAAKSTGSAKLSTLLLGVVAWAAAALVAFRYFFLSSFDSVSGDRGDGRMIVYLHEHLFNALLGRAQFLSPPFFYPQKDVLGYTDAFVLNIVPYVAFRSMGLDPFLSFQTLAIALSLCCFLSSLIIAMRHLRLRSAFAICASILVTFPNNLLFKTGFAHINLFALYYIPCILLIALWGLEDFPHLSRWSLTRVAIGATLFGLLFSTNYYSAWMFAFTAAIGACVIAITLHRDLAAAIRSNYVVIIKLAGVAILGLVLGLIPLTLIYAPTLATFGGRPYLEYIFYAPYLMDVIDVSEWNMVWGSLVQHLVGDGGIERTLAVTPGMTVILIVMALRVRADDSDLKRRAWQPLFAAVCVLVWALSWVVTMRISTFSLFWLPHHVLPGANAIRAGGRIQLLVNLWVVAGLVVMLQYWIDTARPSCRRRNVLLSSVILIFCLVEQINLFPTTRLSRSREQAWLSSLPKPPPECRAFFVNVSGRTANFLDENDAMWISWQTGLPTLNGSSGQFPPGWRLEDPKIEYHEAVRQWISKARLEETVCVYDRASLHWFRF